MENASRNRLSKKNKTLINNIEARSTLLEDAGKEYDINYSKTLGDSDYHISRKDFIKDIKNNPNLTDSQRKDEIKKLTNKEYIFLKEGPESGKNPEVLAHEIGHIETGKLSNPMDAYTKWRSKGREANKFREYTGGSEGKDPKIANEDFSGIRGYLKLKRRNRGVNNVLMEEENASKNAKESLKKLHNQGKLTKEELNDAEKNLDIDYRSYEDDAIVYKNIAKLKRLNDKNRKRK